MTSVSVRSVLSAESVHRLVEQWCAALGRQAAPAELLPLLANGLLLELPGHTVHGAQEFRTWYLQTGAEGLIAEGGRPVGEVRVRLVSPVHAQVAIGPGAAEAAAPPRLDRDSARQTWWVVLQADEPRIRGIAVHQPAPVGVLTSV